jgi:hypothetical protein
MKNNKNFSRRQFLGTSGTAIILPFLESMMTREAIAQEANKAKRMLCYFTSCGVMMDKWKPATLGDAYTMTQILQPLESMRKDFSVISNVSNLVSKDLVSAHSIGTAGWLTGVDPKPGIQAGISAEQVAAQKIGGMTPYRSLQLSQRLGNRATEIGALSDSTYCDVISWADTKTPLIPQSNPRAIFDTYFSGTNSSDTEKEKAVRAARQKSVLDATLSQLQTLKNKLGKDDTYKVDQYMTALREIEKDVGKVTTMTTCPVLDRPEAETASLPGMVSAYPAYYAVMHKLIVLAFQCDMTRFISFMFSPGRSERSFNFAPLNIVENMHDLSHGGGADNNAKQALIQAYEMKMFASILQSLKEIPDINGSTLFDTTISVYGNELSSGGGHTVSDLPLVIAGGGGALKLGHHIKAENGTDLANFWLTILNNGLGLGLPSFGTLGTKVMAGL